MKVFIYNLLGLPFETVEDIKQTIQINRIAQPERSRTSIFFPYPGTKLYEVCKENNFLGDDFSIDLERTQSVLHLPSLSKRRIQNEYIWFEYNVSKGYRSYPSLLLDVVIKKIMSDKNFAFFNRVLRSEKLRKSIRTILKGIKR